MTLEPIPEYEPPTTNDPGVDEQSAESWRAWLEDEPQT